jgi:pyruvate dehydrogenase E2 component (dihydrolipoamide acetyltransferase)
MPIHITMPALSPTMEEGTLSKWLVIEGQSVKSGDVLAEIETDKATMEVEAVDEGVIAKLLVASGTPNVKVNSVIAILAVDGEKLSDAALTSTAAIAPKTSAPEINNAAPAPVAAPVPKNDTTRIFASPLARRIGALGNIDLTKINGSGPKGRIVKTDVESFITSNEVSEPTSQPYSNDQILKLFTTNSYTLIPHDGMRKTIARRLQESKQTIPHFYVSVDCVLDSLLLARTQINDAAPLQDSKPIYKISVNDMVIKAMGMALRDVPDANVSWTDANMVKHKHVDVGVAVSIEGGLITPIIRQAELKSLLTISREMKDLGARAKSRKLKPEEYQGGTTAISNMGMMGVKNFAAVVNPPHATILAVGAGEERVIVKNGVMMIANMMSVTLSTDHRAVDGALGAELLGAFKRYIENPLSMMI